MVAMDILILMITISMHTIQLTSTDQDANIITTTSDFSILFVENQDKVRLLLIATGQKKSTMPSQSRLSKAQPNLMKQNTLLNMKIDEIGPICHCIVKEKCVPVERTESAL